MSQFSNRYWRRLDYLSLHQLATEPSRTFYDDDESNLKERYILMYWNMSTKLKWFHFDNGSGNTGSLFWAPPILSTWDCFIHHLTKKLLLVQLLKDQSTKVGKSWMILKCCQATREPTRHEDDILFAPGRGTAQWPENLNEGKSKWIIPMPSLSNQRWNTNPKIHKIRASRTGV